MTNQQIDQHFERFIQKHSHPCYEDWIAELHPEDASEGLLGLGQTIIESKFYEADNEYLKYWNKHLDSSRFPVQSISSHNDGNSSDESGFHDGYYRGMDLLSGGDNDGDSQTSPQSKAKRTKDVQLAPGEDLLKFD
ncbi:expressed unknown protein [Seminavis robusta]|uniref:Uncharacterized protein n=1 Tax=Seminavis robusta TaxID=568900 RepID=A0A9N8EH84_9STRA|nr:expressed unknown protein [Seminavis robusta]|eukprot:Sro1200_g251890.1 n/a (136) ;mRNA; f:20922-21329